MCIWCCCQDDDIPGIVRYHTYEVLKREIDNPNIRWAYLPYSMHMAGPREAIQHMIIRKNYGEQQQYYSHTTRSSSS
jgi:sulfate adenylyltransferase